MDTLSFILKKYNLSRFQESPIELYCNRFYSFPNLFKQLGFTRGVEVGVARGRFGIRLLQLMPKLKYFGVDVWRTYPGYVDIRSPRYMRRMYEDAMSKFAAFPKRAEIIRQFSMDAVKRFAENSIDFVYIDAGHDYKSVSEDIRAWHKIVRKGGIVAGHDYTNAYRSDVYRVKEAVNDWIKEQDIKPLFLYTKKGDATWFYVKYDGYTRFHSRKIRTF